MAFEDETLMVGQRLCQGHGGLAKQVGFPTKGLILGGDHLGPNPWRKRPAREAMEEAFRLVEGYVSASLVKIHLDASMPLGDDPANVPPAKEVVAQRRAPPASRR